MPHQRHSQSEAGKFSLAELEAVCSWGSRRHGLSPKEDGVLGVGMLLPNSICVLCMTFYDLVMYVSICIIW